MSYCALIFFKDGLPDTQMEFRNSWGGAARIWDALFDKYVKDPNISYDSWIARPERQKELWKLADRKDISESVRAVHAFTFDGAAVLKKHFPRLANDLLVFQNTFPVVGCVDHLPAWADAIAKSDAQAVGLHATSVSENPWMKWDEEKDIATPVPLSEAWEVYDALIDKSEAETPEEPKSA